MKEKTIKEYIYNSRDLFYKSPFGAVEQNTEIKFTLALPMQMLYAQPQLVLHGENIDISITMDYEETMDDRIIYRCAFTPEIPQIIFYHFKVKTGNEIYTIKKSGGGVGSFYHSSEGNEFQITVYKTGYKTPDIFKGGLMYQIFPDRFHRSGKDHENIPEDRFLRSDWGGMPRFIPNEKGEVLNNDFFGGDLKGIENKLPYLEQLGVTIIYLNPVFESQSNHRYDTADYMKIDPLLGTEQDFIDLCSSAKKRGIRIILDGVFSHTGSDSVYFNKNRRYPVCGAYNSKESPYYDWYSFGSYPDEYRSWWGFTTLPEINELNSSYIEFICGENGVIRHWLRLGASGFRLDVADELPDEFIEHLRKAVKAEGEENLLIGEVWEDASNKEAYGKLRRYFLGDELDSVMNYPFKNALLDFIKYGDKELFFDQVYTIVENYPVESLSVAMNSLSTHDTERAITYIAGEKCYNKDRLWQSQHQLDQKQYLNGVKKLKAAMAIQYFLPGIPCLYYGDEAGLQGYKDPFNRMCFPWNNENIELLEFCRTLGRDRNDCPGLKRGTLQFLESSDDLIIIKREDTDGCTIAAVNYSDHNILWKHHQKGFKVNKKLFYNDEVEVQEYNYIILTKRY